MEQNRNPLPIEEINAAMERYRSYKKFSKEQLDLIREDLEYGFTPEEIKIYTSLKDFRKMKVLSKCLRADFSKEAIDFISATGLSVDQMETFYDIHLEGASLYELEQIKVIAGNSSHQIRTAYNTFKKMVSKELEAKKEADEKPEEPKTEESKSSEEAQVTKEQEEPVKSDAEKQEYSSRLVSDIKEFIKKELETVKEDEELRQRLVDQIAEKDSDLSAKQDELNNAIGKVQSLSKENEELKKEMDLLKKELEERKEQSIKVADKKNEESELKADKSEIEERDVSEMEEKVFNQNPIGIKGISVAMPVYYQIPAVDNFGKTVMDVTVGRDERKSSGIFSVMSKLLFKKKSRADIVKLVASGNLVPDQLVQIKIAIERGLTEGQLVELINNNLTPDRMKEIIEIAVLENSILC